MGGFRGRRLVGRAEGAFEHFQQAEILRLEEGRAGMGSDGVHDGRWEPLLCLHRTGSKKSPSGVAPEGQSRWYDQDPLGACATAETTTEIEATAERPRSETKVVLPGRIIEFTRKKPQVGPGVKNGPCEVVGS